jgi:hypothetical protein
MTTHQQLFGDKPVARPARSKAKVILNAPLNTKVNKDRIWPHVAAEANWPAPAGGDGPLTVMLYMTEDFRSVTFTGDRDAYPPTLDWHALLHWSPPHRMLHRMTAPLWRSINRQLVSIWPTLPVAERDELADRLIPILEYVRSQQWPLEQE